MRPTRRLFVMGCCLQYQTFSQDEQTLYKIKVMQLALLGVNLTTFESLHFYLHTLNVTQNEEFSIVDFHRILYYLAMICAIIFFITFSKKHKINNTNQEERNAKVCNICRKEFVDSFPFKKQPPKCTYIYVECIHSFVWSSSFLISSFLLISALPNDYNHYLEVVLKLGKFLFDVVLSLLFTHSCLIAEAIHKKSNICFCPPDSVAKIASSSAPPVHDSSSEDELFTALLTRKKKHSKSYTYAQLS